MPSRASYGARGVGRFLETIAGNMREERLMQRRSEEEASTDRRRANMRMGEQTLAQFLEESSPQYQQNLKHQANEDARLTRQIETDNLNAATAAERERRLGAAADESIEEAKERRARERRERDENKSESLKRAEKEDLWAQYAREYIRVDPVTVLDEGGFHQLTNTDTYKGHEQLLRKAGQHAARAGTGPRRGGRRRHPARPRRQSGAGRGSSGAAEGADVR